MTTNESKNSSETSVVERMVKTTELKEDGRTIIYYRFETQLEAIGVTDSTAEGADV